MIAAVIPVFNPEPGLCALCESLAKSYQVIVVDDGSIENTASFASLPKSIKLLRHAKNMGKGYAIKTALRYILDMCPDVSEAISVDGDGQHSLSDVDAVVDRCVVTGKTVLGVRDFKDANVPLRSRFGNVLTSFLVRVLYKLPIHDTQTGLRAIPRHLFNGLIEVPGNRYEFEMRLFAFLRNNRESLEMVPIRTIYLENNRASHFRPIRDSYMIYKGLFQDATFLTFGVSGIIAFLVDNIVFAGLLVALHPIVVCRRYEILISLSVARVLSSTLNYVLNRMFVFKSTSKIFSSYLRYWALALLIAGCSYAFTACVSALLDASGIVITYIKIVGDMLLFIISYCFQKKWVFSRMGGKYKQ